MKRKYSVIFGNMLLVSGLILMVGSVAFSILSQFIEAELPAFLINSAVMGIFIGAILWLVGARISGSEEITDRYWWARHVCKRREERHS